MCFYFVNLEGENAIPNQNSEKLKFLLKKLLANGKSIIALVFDDYRLFCKIKIKWNRNVRNKLIKCETMRQFVAAMFQGDALWRYSIHILIFTRLEIKFPEINFY